MDENSLHRICTFIPLGHRSDPAANTVADLIQMALCLAKGRRLSPTEIQTSIKTLTSGIAISQPEIEGALAALDAAQAIQKHHEIANAYLYSVSAERSQKAFDELAAIEAARQHLRGKLFSSFENHVDLSIRPLAQELTDETEAYLKDVIRINGVLAIQSIYGDEDPSETLVPRSDATTRSPIQQAAIRNAVADCFRSADSASRRYLIGLVQAGVSYAALHLDPQCSRLLCRPLRIKQMKVLVDTNIIFRLLGLNGEFFRQGAIDVVKASRALGCQLLLSTATLREYKATLKGHLADLQTRVLPKSNELINLLAGTLDEFDFRLAYLQQRATRGSHFTPGLFQERYLSIESDIQELGIKLIPGTVEKEIPESDAALLDLHSRYNTWINGHGANRSADAIAHDVRLLEYVRRSQVASADTIDEAGVVFLTCDRFLARFAADRFSKNRRGLLPTCVTVETWMQYVAPLLPRLSDYEGGFLNFLVAPFVPQSPLSFDDAAQVLARIEGQVRRSETAVLEMLYGTRARAFSEKIAGKSSVERNQLIDATYSQEVSNVERGFQEQMATVSATLAEQAARTHELAVAKDREAAERSRLETKIREDAAVAQTLTLQIAAERASRAELEKALDAESQQRARAVADAQSAATEAAERARQQDRQIFAICVLAGALATALSWGRVSMAASISLSLDAVVFAALQHWFRGRRHAIRWILPGVLCALLAGAAIVPSTIARLDGWLNKRQGTIGFLDLIVPAGVAFIGRLARKRGS